MKLDQSCSSKPPDSYSHSHRSPAHSPPAPRTPLHLRILVRFGGFEVLLPNVIWRPGLLVSLVLLRSADLGPVLCRLPVGFGGFAPPVGPGSMAGRELWWL